jgi:phospholipid-binding lipoprotein MlaA
MKLHLWVIVVLAVATAGCAVSEKTPASNYVAEPSANARHPLVAANHPAPAAHDPAAPPADDDFGLLEDELLEQTVEIADPLEPWNRLMYGANDILYFWLLEPCAQGCKAVLPEPARIGIRNFFHNLATPARLVNCLLQGKADSADTEFHRFVVNTTAGILGFGDPARDQLGLEPAQEDLGQTLATHGLRNGFYIVWPLVGPSTLRDSLGMLGDLFLNPVFYVEPTETAIGISAVKTTNENSFHLGEYETFKAAALEPYVAMRQAYIQYRDKQIQQ